MRLPANLGTGLDRVRSRLPEPNFITIHYAVFITVAMVASLIFWGSTTPLSSISYTDSLFLTVSAVTEAGLNSVNLSQISSWQQAILFILIIAGSPIFVSCAVVFVRLRAFEKAFVEYKQERLSQSRSWPGWWPKKLSRARPLREAELTEKSTSTSGSSNHPAATPTPPSTRVEDAPIGDNRAAQTGDEPQGEGVADIAMDDNVAEPDRGRTLTVEDGATRPQCPSISPAGRDSEHEDHPTLPTPAIGFAQDTRFGPSRGAEPAYKRVSRPLFSFTGVGASAQSSLPHFSKPNASESRERLSRTPSFQAYDQSRAERWTSQGWISRNSQFHGLTFEERHRLGGKEYRAVVLLSFLVPLYLIMWQGLGAISMGAYIRAYHGDIARENGQIPFWVGAFMAVSAFGNSGMSLMDANMIAFQNSAFILVSMSLLILAGNTAYPIFLRGAIWTMWRLLPENERWREQKSTCRFLLDHPRRVYTNLFPSKHTWWLAFALVVLNGLDWMFFEVLSIGDSDIESLSETTRVLGGLFQAFAVRSGGFYVVAIPALRLSLQFLYVIMMYISVYPVTISIRNSNVYEERSLGIFAEDIDHEATHEDCIDRNEAEPTPIGALSKLKRRVTGFAGVAAPAPRREKRSYFMRQQLRAQLAHDAWFAVVAIFLILIIETNQLEADPVNFSVFNVIFEVISGYATVGLSVGLPNAAYSFSGSWHVLSKLVLCAVMLRGRHRGLPVAIDHAVQLPGRNLWDAEDEDGERRMEKMERYESRVSRDGTTPSVMLQSPTALRESTARARVSRPAIGDAR